MCWRGVPGEEVDGIALFQEREAAFTGHAEEGLDRNRSKQVEV